MISDAKLREQTYSYFLTEAQDLLQSIEQNLFSLRHDRSPAKVHELMRASHTLKGAAASVGFESMKSIAHSFEDVFKAFYKPEVEIDAELEALMYEGYECLRSPLSAAIAGVPSQDAELLNRSEAIFSKIRKKLGKHFDAGAALPTSSELGFDIVRSLFETGVQERLEQLEISINQGDSISVTQTLQTQAEVFLGLAESINLVGFGAIAQTALTALKRHPNQVREIAQAALADFRQGQTAVLEGDRVTGGEISETLRQLAGLTTDRSLRFQQTSQSTWARFKQFLRGSDRGRVPLIEPAPAISEANDLFVVAPELEEMATQFATLEVAKDEVDKGFELWDEQPIQAEPPALPKLESVPQKPITQDTVRVDLAHLESLHFVASELFIHQNQQLLQDERIQGMLTDLLDRLNHHQQVLAQLQDWSLMAPERSSRGAQSFATGSKLKQFDTLELDRYDELHLILQTALTEAQQIETSAEAIDFLARESRLARSKQGRLLTNLRDDLMAVRMIPIGTVLNRFPAVVQQLSETHSKTVNLRLSGTQVMIEKALAEKLYDPLLHLVRNAFDHGIESDINRQKQGKAIGEIEIRTYQQGNRTFVEVSDDGCGLDLQRICQRGFEQQRLSSNQVEQFSRDELVNLLFEPGFSTTEAVTDLSGRGVGLDVVRSQMKAIQGNVTVASVPNQGTTFSMQLPITLVSARLLVCQAGQAIYGLSSEEVERIASPDSIVNKQLGNQRILRWYYEGEEHNVPIYALSSAVTYTNWLAGVQSATHSENSIGTAFTLTSSVLILKRQNSWIGIEVDRVLGEQELILRPIGSAIAPPSYVYGCSVLGDGRSLLAIDALALVEQFCSNPGSIIVSPQSPALQITKSVLVIDDSITVRQMVAATLDSAGYQVIQAQDGLDAIEQLQKHPEIQLITCDVEMPRLNGFEFLMRYEQEAQLNPVPVVMLTSRSNEKHQQLAQQLGAAAYLTKPFDQSKLVQLVNQLIEGKVMR